jgi:hypothetical protein
MIELLISATITFGMTTPTARSDGMPLEPHEIALHNLYQDGTLVASGPDTTVTLSVRGCPTAFTSTTTDLDGRESVHSEPIAVCARRRRYKVLD